MLTLKAFFRAGYNRHWHCNELFQHSAHSAHVRSNPLQDVLMCTNVCSFDCHGQLISYIFPYPRNSCKHAGVLLRTNTVSVSAHPIRQGSLASSRFGYGGYGHPGVQVLINDQKTWGISNLELRDLTLACTSNKSNLSHAKHEHEPWSALDQVHLGASKLDRKPCKNCATLRV